ncbi:MAG TPA: prepilin peptidase [Acidimicrobiales bacterium]|nr:prepilin peptidase [Acidimicrobiales bacterium]
MTYPYAPAITAGAALGGAVFGSFLNVVIYRVPAGKSLLPNSSCFHCGTELKWRDNVPVLGWLALRGRARCCGNRIPARYPAIEALTAVLFALIAALVAPAAMLTAYVTTAGLIALSAIDLDTKTLPKKIIWPTAAAAAVGVGLHTALRHDPGVALRAAACALAVSGVFLLIHLAQPSGFGFGDVRLGVLIGLATGATSVWAALYGVVAAFALGSAVGVALVAGRRAERKTALPFGPFLAAGCYLALVAGFMHHPVLIVGG